MRAFVFSNAMNPAARFRNTVIGTLVQDLSAAIDLEQAVRSFEAKVAPQNYQRPRALITPAMVKAAMKTIDELGIEESLRGIYNEFLRGDLQPHRKVFEVLGDRTKCEPTPARFPTPVPSTRSGRGVAELRVWPAGGR